MRGKKQKQRQQRKGAKGCTNSWTASPPGKSQRAEPTSGRNRESPQKMLSAVVKVRRSASKSPTELERDKKQTANQISNMIRRVARQMDHLCLQVTDSESLVILPKKIENIFEFGLFDSVFLGKCGLGLDDALANPCFRVC